MPSPMPRIPLQPFTQARVASLGDVGAQWVARLPDILSDLAARWSITIGDPLPGGSASYVALAATADGQEAVVKVALAREGLDDQVRTIEAARGHGYVLLLAHDLDRHALLMERLGPSLDHSGMPPEEQIEALVATLRLAWETPPSAGMTVRPGADKASQLHRLISDLWERLGHPCPENIVAQALAFAERRAAAFDLGRCVVVHGDPHPGNALRVLNPRAGAESGFCFVDPDGFLCDRAYDLGVVLRDWSVHLRGEGAREVAEGYCRLLARLSDVDEQSIWEWGYTERVSTGLYAMASGARVFGQGLLDSAGRLID